MMEKKGITRFVTLAACLVLVLMFGRVGIASAYTSGDWEYSTETVSGTTVAKLINYTGSAASVTVPAKIDGYQVRTLENVFYGNNAIVQVTIPNGVQSLKETFSQCKNLKSVSLPASVEAYYFAFRESGIETITLPDATYDLTGAFVDCTALKKVTILGKANALMDTFMGCKSLETVSIKSVNPVYNQFGLSETFSGCENLKTVTLPEGVTYLFAVFRGCYKLKEIHLPATVSEIDSTAFVDCWALDEIYYGGSKCAWTEIVDLYTPGEGDRFLTAKMHFAKTGGHDFTDWGLYTEPTCTENGEETRNCVRCGEEEKRTVPKLGHQFSDWIVEKKATASQTGVKARYCKACGLKEIAEIAKLAPEKTKETEETKVSSQTTAKTAQTTGKKTFTVKLKKNKFTYNGKAQKPVIKGVYVNGRKIAKKYYTVTYKNNKKVGKGTVIVKGKGKYKGYKGSLKFKIVLKKPQITKLASSKAGTVTIFWQKDSQAKNFQVQICQSKSFSSGVKKVWVGKKGKKLVKGLKSKKTYYVRIRAYTNANGVKWYSPWSKVKTIKIK